MKVPTKRAIFVTPLALFIVAYIVGAVALALDDRSVVPISGEAAGHEVIAIFGASGTAGDGILKAALADPGIRKIHVVTRRVTPRMEQGAAAGKVQITEHKDYLDYSAVRSQIAEASAVFWAIGTSSLGVDQDTYAMIHVDFPMRFVEEWADVIDRQGATFHYISSSDIGEDSRIMWAREKYRAETSLFGFAEGRNLRVIAYRPDYIGPTTEESHFGQKLLYWFFAPVGAAVQARQIGQAMIEVTARGVEFENGATIGTRGIHRYSDAYERRRGLAVPDS